MGTKKKVENWDGWVMQHADQFEMDCRPERRETGITIPDRLQRLIDEFQAKKAKKAKSAKG